MAEPERFPSAADTKSAHGHAVFELRPGVRLAADPESARDVLLSPERGVFLDASASAVLRLIDGSRDLDGVVAALLQEYAVERSVLEADVRVLVDELARLHLLRARPKVGPA